MLLLRKMTLSCLKRVEKMTLSRLKRVEKMVRPSIISITKF